MSIRNNFKYSLILTLSTYLVPLLVFPYISRVLGAERIGAIDTVDGIIDYLVLFSMMGMQALGIREIARHKDDKAELQSAFNDLFGLTPSQWSLPSSYYTSPPALCQSYNRGEGCC